MAFLPRLLSTLPLLLLLLSGVISISACTGRRCKQIDNRDVVVFPQASGESGGAGRCFIDSIINFGDSISDTGNLLRQGGAFATIIGKLPYGETNPAGPTGRCSDGLLIVDNIASALGVPQLPPYLDESAKFDRGVNFAVAGATALSQSFLSGIGVALPYTTSSLEVQLGWFKQYLASVCPSTEDCPQKLERTLFLVGEIGGNDYNFALMQNKSLDQVKALVPQVVTMITDVIQSLIGDGARHVLVPGNFPIGCMPSYLTVFGNGGGLDEKGCKSELNEFAQFHNQHLQDSLTKLSQENPNITMVYADYYSTFLEMVNNPGKYGLDESSMLQACCGTGGSYSFSMAQMCGSPGVPVCADPSKSISWDGIHLTQAAYEIMANQLISSIDFFKEWKCSES